jgi:hypothetical protein
MANDVSSRTWFIDTQGAGVIWQPQVYLKFIEVVAGAGASTIGAQMAIINDRNSKNIINSFFQTVGPNEIQTYNIENWFEGIIVPTLSAAPAVTLRIHVK